MHRAALKNAAIKAQEARVQEPVASAPEGAALSPEQIEEAKLRAKYGGALPKKKAFQKEQQYFDSADWALSKSGDGDVKDPGKPGAQAAPVPPEPSAS